MGGCAARVAKLAPPTVGGAKPQVHTIQRGALPQPRFARQLTQRGSQGHFVPAGGYEPPLQGAKEARGSEVDILAGGEVAMDVQAQCLFQK